MSDKPIIAQQVIPHQIAVPHHYFNGFSLSGSLSDVNCQLTVEGRPVAALNMSFTTAKTLMENLTEVIAKLESATDNSIMTMDDVRLGYERMMKKDASK